MALGLLCAMQILVSAVSMLGKAKQGKGNVSAMPRFGKKFMNMEPESGGLTEMDRNV